MKEDAVREPRLQLKLEHTSFKAMDLEVEKVIITTTGFKLKLCEWNRINIFTIVPMDDFQVVLFFLCMNLGL